MKLADKFRRRFIIDQRRNWYQLLQFSLVGGSGFIVNLMVYGILLGMVGKNHYLYIAVPSFLIANLSNYLINRYWTFRSHGDHAHPIEYTKFLIIGILALVGNLLILKGLVEGAGVGELAAQAVAIILVTPVNFVGNKLWTFSALRGKR